MLKRVRNGRKNVRKNTEGWQIDKPDDRLSGLTEACSLVTKIMP